MEDYTGLNDPINYSPKLVLNWRNKYEGLVAFSDDYSF